MLYEARGRGRRVRLLALALVAFLAVMAWLAWDASLRFGLAPSEGSALAPAGQPAAVAALAVARDGDARWYGRQRVDAPWVTLQLTSGRRLLVDLQGDIRDRDALSAIFEPGRRRSLFHR